MGKDQIDVFLINHNLRTFLIPFVQARMLVNYRGVVTDNRQKPGHMVIVLKSLEFFSFQFPVGSHWRVLTDYICNLIC